MTNYTMSEVGVIGIAVLGKYLREHGIPTLVQIYTNYGIPVIRRNSVTSVVYQMDRGNAI